MKRGGILDSVPGLRRLPDFGLRSLQVLTVAGMVLLAGLLGAALPYFIDAAGDSSFRLLALPALLVLGFLFLFARSALFYLIIMVRAAIDPIISAGRFAPYLGLGAAINALMIAIAMLLAIERPRYVWRIVLPMWLPLVLVTLLAAARSPDPVQGIRTFMAYITYVAVFAVPFCLKAFSKDMGFSIRLILLSSLVPVAYGFVDFLTGACGRPDLRICSTFEHPNIFAFYIVVVIALAFYLIKSPLIRTPKAQRWMLRFYLLILLTLLVLTKTRSAWAACFMVFLIYGLLIERKYLFYLAAVSVIALFIPAVQDRLLDLSSTEQYVTSGGPGNSYEWRKTIWEAALGWMDWQAWPLGYGLDSFMVHSLSFFELSNGLARGAHNVYVQWFFEAGIVGVACAAWLYFKVFALLIKGMRYDRLGTVIMITVVIEYLMAAFSDNMLNYLAFNWYYWFMVGSACAIVVARRDQENDETQSTSVEPPGPEARPGGNAVTYAGAGK